MLFLDYQLPKEVIHVLCMIPSAATRMMIGLFPLSPKSMPEKWHFRSGLIGVLRARSKSRLMLLFVN